MGDVAVILCGVHIFSRLHLWRLITSCGEERAQLFACLLIRIMLLVSFMSFWFSSSVCLGLASSSDYGVP